MAALGNDVIIVHQRLGAIAGAVDNDAFSQRCEVVPACKLPFAQSHAASFQLGDELRQQDRRVDQPGPVFAADDVQFGEREGAGSVLGHDVVRRALVVGAIPLVERVVSSQCDAVGVPVR